MLTLDYNQLVIQENRAGKILANLLGIYQAIRSKWLLKSINKRLAYYLAELHSAHDYLEKQQSLLKGKKLSAQLNVCNEIISKVCKMIGKTERALEIKQDPELQKTHALFIDLFSITCDISLIFRRNNLKVPRATRSEEATIALLGTKKKQWQEF